MNDKDLNENLIYYLNDPSTPKLEDCFDAHIISKINNGSKVFEKIYGDLNINELNLRTLNVYLNCYNALNYLESILNERINFEKKLKIYPNYSRGLKTIYDKNSLKFFCDEHEVTKNTVYTSNSSKIIFHTFFHAVIDALRPDLWNIISIEINSFVEALCDIFAMTMLMQNEKISTYALEETNGNLNKSNIITKFAEEVGNTLYYKDSKLSKIDCMRDATDILLYKNPKEISHENNMKILSSEKINFSRIYSSAWYSIVVGMYNSDSKKEKESVSLKYAANKAFYTIFKAFLNSPKTFHFYETISKLIIKHSSHHSGLIKSILFSRKIINKNTTLLNKKSNIYELKISKINRIRYINLKNFIDKEIANYENVKLELPDDFYYEFYNNDDKDEIYSKIKDFTKDIEISLNYISDYEKDYWEIKNGKLVRKKI